MTGLRKLPVWAKILIGIGGWFFGELLIFTIFYKNMGMAMFLHISFIILYPIVFYKLSAKKKIMQIRCPNCKYEGQGKFIIKGSFGMEVVLWLCFLVPGIIYSVWRVTTKRFGCPQCDYEYVVKLGMVKVTS